MLLDEIRARCDAALLNSRDTAAIAAKVSEGRARPRATAIGPGTILDVLGLETANVFLDVIDSQPDFRWAKTVLFRTELDLSTQTARMAVLGMQQAGVLTEAQAGALLALAVEPDPIDEFAVRRACWSDSGEWLP